MLTMKEFVDTILSLLNRLVDAKGLDKVLLIAEITQMLMKLKDALDDNEAMHEKEKKFYEEQIEDLSKQLNGEEVEPGKTYHLDLQNPAKV